MRSYQWGTVPTLSAKVSDLLLLLDLLLGLSFEPMKQATEDRYHRYRHVCTV